MCAYLAKHLRARYYDPSTGQFLSRDPMVATTRSAYGCVAGSPLNGSDPTGLCTFGIPDSVCNAVGTVAHGVGEVGDLASTVTGAAATVTAFVPVCRRFR
jgi:uncharacterized protein RhaS with RHS repeats